MPEMCDPRKVTGMSGYCQEIKYHQGSLKVPKTMSPGELEWEYYVSRLHWNYVRSTPEDLEKIKEIANRIS